MMIAQNNPKELSSAKRLLAALLGRLASVKFAVTIVMVLAAVCVVGTLLPQGAEVTGYLQKNPGAKDRMEFLATLGLTHVFSAWWFIALLGVLAASVATCSSRRWATVRRSSGTVRRRAIGSVLSHISILLILAGGVIRGVWGEKGFLELKTGSTSEQFRVEEGQAPLPFGLHLVNFQIETYEETSSDTATATASGGQQQTVECEHLLVDWPARQLMARLPIQVGHKHVLHPPGEAPTPENSFNINVVRYVPDFVIDSTNRVVRTRSNEPHNPAILVAVSGPSSSSHRWLFAKFPDYKVHTSDTHSEGSSPLKLTFERHDTEIPMAPTGPVKSFRSEVRVIENNEITLSRTIEVNSPLTYKGYTFYQSGYNPNDLAWSTFQVVRDPGVPVVYAGFSLLIAGLSIIFYLNPWLESRKANA